MTALFHPVGLAVVGAIKNRLLCFSSPVTRCDTRLLQPARLWSLVPSGPLWRLCTCCAIVTIMYVLCCVVAVMIVMLQCVVRVSPSLVDHSLPASQCARCSSHTSLHVWHKSVNRSAHPVRSLFITHIASSVAQVCQQKRAPSALVVHHTHRFKCGTTSLSIEAHTQRPCITVFHP
jgi:hypothetical protein